MNIKSRDDWLPDIYERVKVKLESYWQQVIKPNRAYITYIIIHECITNKPIYFYFNLKRWNINVMFELIYTFIKIYIITTGFSWITINFWKYVEQ